MLNRLEIPDKLQMILELMIGMKIKLVINRLICLEIPDINHNIRKVL